MNTRRAKETKAISPRQRPATTNEARESQMVALAVDRAEQQLRDGTASAQVITHFLKLGSSREVLEQARLREDITHLQAKTEAAAGQQRADEIYKEALAAMRRYTGQDPVETEPDYDD